jgi:hypothetical protein
MSFVILLSSSVSLLLTDGTVFLYAAKFDNKGAKLCGNTWKDTKGSGKKKMFIGSMFTDDIVENDWQFQKSSYCFCGIGESFSTTHGTSPRTCDPCAAGKFQGEAFQFKGICTPCSPGKFSTVAAMEKNECKDCLIGKSQASAGEPFCESCQPGTIQSLPGQSKCLDCEIGLYRPRQIQKNGVMTDTELTKCKQIKNSLVNTYRVYI